MQFKASLGKYKFAVNQYIHYRQQIFNILVRL